MIVDPRRSAPGNALPLPLITVAVPSLNQGRFLAAALDSIFAQGVDVEVFVADGGSTDESLSVIRAFESRLSGWRSHPDRGQAAAVNECVARGGARYVCWLNSDDVLLPGALQGLVAALDDDSEAPAAYGRGWKSIEGRDDRTEVHVEPFDFVRLSRRCIVSQPATLIRRSAWDAVGGLDERLHFAMDYDLWWRLYRQGGPLRYVDRFIAVDREHPATKSINNSLEHFRESVDVVRRHGGYEPAWTRFVPLPVRWRLAHAKRRVRTMLSPSRKLERRERTRRTRS